MITQDLVKELFDYRDGYLYWRHKVNKKHGIDAPAGTINNLGYCVITINGKKIHGHRLVWLWHGKELPEQIDHINGDRKNNRIENLRAANCVTNAFNSKLKSNNKSGIKGVSWCNTYKKWIVQIYAFKKKVTGRFKSLEEAVAFAKQKRQELHGEYANEGV
jgi:hypothetical protein